MTNKNLLTKTLLIFFFLCTSNNLFADIQKEINKKKLEESKLITEIFQSKYKSFDKLRFNFDEDYKLVFDNTGNVIMYLSNNYMNIDLENIFNYVKFDLDIDKEKIYTCSFNSNDNNCKKKYITINAADEITGGILNITNSLFREGLSVEKKFDALEFAKIIKNNENFIKQIINKHIIFSLSNSKNINTKDNNTEEKKDNSEKTIVKGW